MSEQVATKKGFVEVVKCLEDDVGCPPCMFVGGEVLEAVASLLRGGCIWPWCGQEFEECLHDIDAVQLVVAHAPAIFHVARVDALVEAAPVPVRVEWVCWVGGWKRERAHGLVVANHVLGICSVGGR